MSLLADRMHDPIHLGAMPDADAVGMVGNPACGDVVTVYLRVDGDVIHAASFESVGSAYQLATASVLCDHLVGRSLADAGHESADAILEALPDLPRNKHHLARLAVDALERALADRARRSVGGRPAAETVHTLSPRAAAEVVLNLLANGREWGTKEVDAMVRAEGMALPGGAARVLATLRTEGRIAGRMDVQARSWRWWRADSPERRESGGDADHE